MATPAYADCADVVSSAAPATTKRPVTAGDLARLRDIGSPDAAIFGQPSPLALSPDGRRLAFVISRGDPATNQTCRALVVINLAGPARPLVLDRGGELITSEVAPRGFLIDDGFPALITPAWSPDGRWVAYLRRDRGITQVWRARADGSGAAVVTHSTVDILALAWTADGRIVFASIPGRPGVAAAIDREGLAGWLYDERIVPNVSSRPLDPAGRRTAFVIDPKGGAAMPAAPSERALVPLDDLSGSPIAPTALSPFGVRAWAEHASASPLSPLKLFVQRTGGAKIACMADTCQGSTTNLWWSPDGRSLIILRREGWADGEMGLYRWTPGRGAPTAILHTKDVIQNCLTASARLICTQENATTPRRIVSIDCTSGRITPLFDPNPEFAGLELGSTERLTWRNDRGLPAWGDLVLPPGYRPDQGRLPMIVVQYHSDGFLRGGTGDEYPIFAFAARGFAVLSTERPPFVAAASPDVRSYQDVNAINRKGWAERFSLLSSIETGVQAAIAKGIADPQRIGITGLSDGATTARFALINTRLFAAAAISNCCVDYRTAMIDGGIGMADFNRALGYPPATKDDPAFWQQSSFFLNAKAMRTPLLLQVSDDEYLLALESFAALREQSQPVEMYVFPGEHHIKWQPAHRLAVYERNLDWFDYWLRDRRDPATEKAQQYARWDALRRRLCQAEPGAPTPSQHDIQASASANSRIRMNPLPCAGR
jgi:dipeptidyl aminopeptidase/acylaminoacyl peptidase